MKASYCFLIVVLCLCLALCGCYSDGDSEERDERKQTASNPIASLKDKYFNVSDDYIEFIDTDGNVILNRSHVLNAAYTYDETVGHAVSLQFNDEGAQLLKDFTTTHLGQTLYVYIDGVCVLAPTVNSAIIDGQTIITGDFEVDEVREICKKIMKGRKLSDSILYVE